MSSLFNSVKALTLWLLVGVESPVTPFMTLSDDKPPIGELIDSDLQ